MSKTVKVINNGTNAIWFGSGKDLVKLERGAHEVDEDKLLAVLENERVKKIFDVCCTILPAQPAGTVDVAANPYVDITTLTLKAAQKLIASTGDREKLKRWAMEDARGEVRKMLHLRDRELLPGDDAAIEDGDETIIPGKVYTK